MDNSQPTCRPIDQHAISIPQNSGLLPCLYIPVAARDTNAIETYVGRIAMQLAPDPGQALLVESHIPDKRDDRLAIWDVPEAVVLHFPRQVWVHVDYRAYPVAGVDWTPFPTSPISSANSKSACIAGRMEASTVFSSTTPRTVSPSQISRRSTSTAGAMRPMCWSRCCSTFSTAPRTKL